MAKGNRDSSFPQRIPKRATETSFQVAVGLVIRFFFQDVSLFSSSSLPFSNRGIFTLVFYRFSSTHSITVASQIDSSHKHVNIPNPGSVFMVLVWRAPLEEAETVSKIQNNETKLITWGFHFRDKGEPINTETRQKKCHRMKLWRMRTIRSDYWG